jgi:hypothetical protein
MRSVLPFLIDPLRSGLRAFGAWRSVGLVANLTLDYHAAFGGARLGHLPLACASRKRGRRVMAPADCRRAE